MNKDYEKIWSIISKTWEIYETNEDHIIASFRYGIVFESGRSYITGFKHGWHQSSCEFVSSNESML